jgi:predicted AAA+ superfamily ATPase
MITTSQLEEIIESQNSIIKGKNTGTKRELFDKITEVEGFASIITGIRRCGKSTLMLQILDGQDSNSLFLNFEDIRLSGFEIADFNTLLAIIEKRGFTKLFFDEIQLIENWELMVRTCLDKNLQVNITGSNAAMLSVELGTKLTGRHLSAELFPFSFTEFLKFTKKEQNLASFEEYLKSGGFPDYVKTGNGQVLRHLLDDILARDIAVRYAVRDINSLRQLCVYMISNIGKPFSATKIKGMFGLNAPSTILEYLSYFEKSYIFQYLPKFSYSLKVQIRNPKKVYAIDLGLFTENSVSFSEESGRRLENAVYLFLRTQTKEIYYFQEKKECDFVVFINGKLDKLIQVCYMLDAHNLQRETEGLLEAMNFFGLEVGFLLTYSQTDEFVIGGKKILVLPVWTYVVGN